MTEYQYDDASRLISVTQPNGDTVSYTYDGHGNRLSMTYPNGKTAEYVYDGMDRLISVKGVDGVTTTYEYDALGRRTKTVGGKETTEYTYDEVGDLIAQTTTGSYDLALEYTYDLSGRMTGESRTEKGKTVESAYTYDPLGQLTGFTRSDGITEGYTYDAAGNMLTKTQSGVQTEYTYNAANQLTKSVTGGNTTAYTYDPNGNLTAKQTATGTTRYTYNALNLLQSYTGEDGYSETYTYNADCLLSSVTTPEATTSLTWDILNGDGVVLSETTGKTTTNYTYGLERISALTGSNRTEYVYDARGSVAAEVSYNNAWYTFGGTLGWKTITSKSYTPFGEQIGEKTSGFGYNGEYCNAVTGQIYLRARFYEPEMNRFSQKDILRGDAADPVSLNRYAYVRNDPVNFIDPSGMSVRSLLKKGVDAITGMARNLAKTAAKNTVSKFKTIVNTASNIVKKTVPAIKNVLPSSKSSIARKLASVKAAIAKTAISIIKKDSVEAKKAKAAIASKTAVLLNAIAGSPNVKGISESTNCGNVVYQGRIDEERDLDSGDKSKADLIAMNFRFWRDFHSVPSVTKRGLIRTWKTMAKMLSRDWFSKYNMQTVVLDMIDHFLDGTGTDYTNDELTRAVSEHPVTQQFMSDFTQQFEVLLKKYNGDYSKFANSDEFRLLLSDNKVLLSTYAYGGGPFDADTYSGLGMAIHGWTGVDVSVTQFVETGNRYSGTLEFVFYDNFGLDEDDVKLDEYGSFAGFRAWYILQHYDAFNQEYKPFVTYVTVDYQFSGQYD